MCGFPLPEDYKYQILTVVARNLIVLSDSIALLKTLSMKQKNVFSKTTLQETLSSLLKISNNEFKLSKSSSQSPVWIKDRNLILLTVKDSASPFCTLKKPKKFHIRDRVYISYCDPKRVESLSRQYVSLSVSRVHIIPTDAE